MKNWVHENTSSVEWICRETRIGAEAKDNSEMVYLIRQIK